MEEPEQATVTFPLIERSGQSPGISTSSSAHKDTEKPEGRVEIVKSFQTGSTEQKSTALFSSKAAFLASTNAWQVELWSALFAFISLTILMVVLRVYDDQDLVAWKLLLTPNAVIDILMSISKLSALCTLASCIGQMKNIHTRTTRKLKDWQLYDDASRGPWGATMIFWKLRTPTIVLIMAALATILSLVIGPTSQQVLLFPTHLLPISGAEPELLYTDSLYVNTSALDPDDLSRGTAWSKFHQMVIQSISTQFSPIDPWCPGDYCHFPDFTTLGVCDSCNMVTETSQVSCTAPDLTTGYQVCNYTTPRGFSLLATVLSSNSDEKPLGPYQGTLINSTVQDPHFPRSDPGNEKGTFNRFAFISHIKRWHASSSYAQVEVGECSLSWCVKGFVNCSWSATEIEHFKCTNLDVPIQFSGSMIPSSYSDCNLVVNINDPTAPPAPSGARAFLVDCPTQKLFQSYLARLLGSLELSANGTSLLEPTLSLTETIYFEESIPRVLASLADALTWAIPFADSNGKALSGQALRVTTHIQVRWLWTIPAWVFLVISIVVLASMMAETSRHQHPLWKNSILPPILQQFDESVSGRSKFDGKGFEERAAELDIRLKRDSRETWRFELMERGLGGR